MNEPCDTMRYIQNEKGVRVPLVVDVLFRLAGRAYLAFATDLLIKLYVLA